MATATRFIIFWRHAMWVFHKLHYFGNLQGTHSGDTVEGAAEALLHFSENRRKKKLVRNEIGGGAQ